MPQRTKLLVIALLLGVVAAALAYVYLSKRSAGADQQVRVVAAYKPIPAGTVIDSGMIEMRSFKRGELPPETMILPEAVIGKVTVLALKQGQPVSAADISQKYRLSHVVDPMMRAVTVGIDPVSGVAGFLKAGDHVDVVSTFNINGGTLTKTVLQDLKLVAIGSEVVSEPTEPTPDAGKQAKATPETKTSATLLVTPMDAEKLILADMKGKIRLVLRRPDDTSYVSYKGVTARSVVGIVPPDAPERGSAGSAPAPRPVAPPRTVVRGGMSPMMPPLPLRVDPLPAMSASAPAAEPKPTVQVIRGTKVEETSVPQ